MTRIADREVNVEAVLTALGVDERGRRGEWIDALCPLHVESNPSFAVSAEHGGWICNHEHLTGGLLDLVAAVRNCSRGEAARWISTQQSAPPSVDTLRERLLGKAIEIPNDDELTQWITRFAGLPIGTLPEYWFDRGFTWAAADAFDVRFDAGPPPALVWPVRDEQANIVGFIERKLPGASGPTWRHVPLQRRRPDTGELRYFPAESPCGSPGFYSARSPGIFPATEDVLRRAALFLRPCRHQSRQIPGRAR